MLGNLKKKTKHRHVWRDMNWEKSSPPLTVGITEKYPHPFTYEDFVIPAGPSLKAKKSGAADPRFKRVVPNVLTEEIANEARKVSECLARAAREDDKPFDSKTIRGSNVSTLFSTKNQSSDGPPSENKTNCTVLGTIRTGIPEESTESKNSVILDKSKSRLEQSQPAKKSVSDCTLHTKNSSIREEDAGDDFTRVQSFTSATRLSKVNNWIREFKPIAEKRRSVITVIGQTQGKSFSTVLNEINQRRKLAKELDKHALCETILQPSEREKENELKNLVAKVDLVSPDGRIVYSTRRVYGFKESSAYRSVRNGKCDEYFCSNSELSKPGLVRINDEIPERDISTNQTQKKKSKRFPKKPDCRRQNVKGAILFFLDNIQNQRVIAVLVLLSAITFSLLIFACQERRILNYLNIGKPRTRSWYEEYFK